MKFQVIFRKNADSSHEAHFMWSSRAPDGESSGLIVILDREHVRRLAGTSLRIYASQLAALRSLVGEHSSHQ